MGVTCPLVRLVRPADLLRRLNPGSQLTPHPWTTAKRGTRLVLESVQPYLQTDPLDACWTPGPPMEGVGPLMDIWSHAQQLINPSSPKTL